MCLNLIRNQRLQMRQNLADYFACFVQQIRTNNCSLSMRIQLYVYT